jgi:hypothetical protein
VVEQDEKPPDTCWHRQGYVELAKAGGKGSTAKKLGFPDIRGKKSRYFYRLTARRGTKAQAAGYCCSTFWCDTHSCGDHADADNLFADITAGMWDYVGDPRGTTRKLTAAGEPEAEEIDHTQCAKYALKYKVSLARISGKPCDEQHGGKRCRQGSGHVEQEIIAAIKTGTPRDELFERYSGWAARYHAWVDKAISLYSQPRRWKPYVVWLHGRTGTGKSRIAGAVCESSCYTKNCDHKWWDGYTGQRVIVLEELRKQFCFSTLLAWFDRRPVTLEYKGGCTQLAAYVMIVTSCASHKETWRELNGEENERIDQLTRRIDLELNMTTATKEERELALWRMRNACHRLSDPANHDREDLYGSWEMGAAPVHPFFQLKAGRVELDLEDTEPGESSGASSSGEPLTKKPRQESA